MTLYAGYGSKVTYDTNGTSTEDRTQALFEENETINYYPSPLNICHIINKWEPTNGNLTVRSEGGSGGNSENAYYIMPAHDVTLKATWSVKIFTITFNDTDLEPVQVECNTKFYPDNYSPPERPGYIFSGWSTGTEGIGGTGVSIFSNYTLTPKWVPITDSQNGSNNSKKSNVGVIVGVTVSILVVIIIAIVIVLLFLMKHSNEDDDDESGYVDDRRDGDLELDERGDSCPYEWVVPAGQDASSEELTKSLNSRSDIYSNRYRAPTLKAALMKAGLGEKRAMKVADTCYEKAEGITDLPEGLTKDDAAALAMYTFDFGVKHYESNPFRLINKDLVTRSKESLKRIRGLLYLVMSALRKLPRVTGRTLYRGVRKDANIDQKHYAEGSVITWSAFSSTSPDMNTTKAFLAKGSEDGKAAGTLFIIEKGWGYSMQPYSLFPNEEEILMEPERKFKVTSVINAELIIITLEMIDSPLVLPQVFGNPADEGR